MPTLNPDHVAAVTALINRAPFFRLQTIAQILAALGHGPLPPKFLA